jgi:hypothetical protein
MWRWAVQHVGWFAIRCAITYACMYTVQNIIHQEQNIWIETQPMVIATACLVVVIKLWSYLPDKKDVP